MQFGYPVGSEVTVESNARFIVWIGLFFILLGASAVPAQDGFRRFSPDRFERKTEKDDQGMIQWAEHDAGRCPTCTGKGKATCIVCERFGDDAKTCPDCERKKSREVTCRTCLGTGGMPDPLEKVQCPTCLGGGFLLCTICGGGGRLKVDKAKRWSDCPGCRGKGGYECGTCDGERHVGVAALKPSLAEADIKKLKKALATTDKVLAGLKAFTPGGGAKVRKEVKALSKLMKDAQGVYPAFKSAQKDLKNYMSKIYAGSNFMGYEQQQAQALQLVKASCEYYLQIQKRMIELALKRQEANAAAEAAQKGK